MLEFTINTMQWVQCRLSTVTDKSDWEIVLNINARYLFHNAYQVFITANCFSGIHIIDFSFLLKYLYNLSHIFIFISVHLFLRYLYTFCRGFSSWNVPNSNQINKRKNAFCCEKYSHIVEKDFHIVRKNSCHERTSCYEKYFLSWKIRLVMKNTSFHEKYFLLWKKYFLLWAFIVAHTLSANWIFCFKQFDRNFFWLRWDPICNGKYDIQWYFLELLFEIFSFLEPFGPYAIGSIAFKNYFRE